MNDSFQQWKKKKNPLTAEFSRGPFPLFPFHVTVMNR